MALDKNLFTLNVEQSKIDPSAIDLVDPKGVIHYRKRRVPQDTGKYLCSLVEPLSESILASATAPGVVAKEKLIELHNPTVPVPLSFKGTLTSKWVFTWEQHEFEWKREECYLNRKPDPPVLVAIHKEPSGKGKTRLVQILDYNLNRFDIDDRKGLEIVLLTSLLAIGDHNDQLRAKPTEGPSGASNSNATPIAAALPPRPPTPTDTTDDQIAIMQAKTQREVNEVIIGESGTVEEYARYCVKLLTDDTLLFITLRSQSSKFVSKVVQIAEATKRIRYKSGAWDEELHQYVDLSAEGGSEKAIGQGKRKGPPPVINLNDPAPAPSSSTYQPLASLVIHLSKISMPELEPKSKKPLQRPRTTEPGSLTSNYADIPQAKLTLPIGRQRPVSSSGPPPQFKASRDFFPSVREQRSTPNIPQSQPQSQPQSPALSLPSARSRTSQQIPIVPQGAPIVLQVSPTAKPPPTTLPMGRQPLPGPRPPEPPRLRPVYVYPPGPGPGPGPGRQPVIMTSSIEPPRATFVPVNPNVPLPSDFQAIMGPRPQNALPGQSYAYAMSSAEFASESSGKTMPSKGFLPKFMRRGS